MTIWEVIEESKYFIKLRAENTVLRLSDQDAMMDAGLELVSLRASNQSLEPFVDVVKWLTLVVTCRKLATFNPQSEILRWPSKAA